MERHSVYSEKYVYSFFDTSNFRPNLRANLVRASYGFQRYLRDWIVSPCKLFQFVHRLKKKKKKRKNASRPRPGVRGTSRGFYEPRKSWRDCSLRESLPWHGIIHGISSRYSRRYLGQAFGFVKQPLRGINPPFSNHPRFFYKIPPPLPWSFSSSTTI